MTSRFESQPRSPRYNSLTAWRGIACLLVIIYHSLFTGNGLAFPAGFGQLGGVLEVLHRAWVGVPLFFVISGYCVTASADAVRRRPNPGVNFFRRRFRRIYPPYWVWLAITALCVWSVENVQPGFFGRVFIPNPGNFTKWQWLGNITLTETWRWHFTGGMENELISPSWTLCYEEQFYALTGIVLLLARRYLFSALALITVAVIACVFAIPTNAAGSFLDGQWLLFAAGALVYYVINYVSPRAVVWACLPLMVGVTFAVANPEHLLQRGVNEPNQTYFCAFCFALLLVFLHRWDVTIAASRLARPLIHCGDMCYSMYLLHWPTVTVVGWGFDKLHLRNPYAILLLGVPFCLAVVICIARVFHRFVERRFLNSGYSQSPPLTE